MAAVLCPYGEPRGAAVYCKASGRTVNPLVLPCRSPNYPRCRFYVEAEKRREREAVIQPAGREGPSRVARWDAEESRRLADPLTTASLIMKASLEASGRLEASSLEELAEKLKTLTPPSGCFLVVAVSRGGEVFYMKSCEGLIVAAASQPRGPLDPERLESIVREVGGLSVAVYRVEGWS